MTRDEVINAVACPPCGAPAGEPCRGRKAPHPKRVGRAEMLHGWQAEAPDTVLARLRRKWRTAAPARGRRSRGRG